MTDDPMNTRFESHPMKTQRPNKFSSLTLIACLAMAGMTGCDKGNEPAADPKTDAAATGDKAEGDAPKAEAGDAPVAAVDPAVEAEAAALVDDLDNLDPKVQKAVQIAREIELDPSSADQVLAKHELDREGLDALMYEIARNPELSKAYRDARMAS